MRALYVSHNGMLEGLGSSQVLPYLRGLARRGVEFDLVSYELPESTPDEIEALERSLARDGIRWTALRRARDPRLVRKVGESVHGIGVALRTALARRPDIIHGRSYLPTAVADFVATALPRARLVFDCRGMIGDEYVDSGYWTPDRIEYRMVKAYERRAFRRAEGVVVLTRALRSWLEERSFFAKRTHVEAIPCCVDLETFRFDGASREAVRQELGLCGATVLVYAGSLGSWYEEAEMVRFAGILRRRADTLVRVLLLTRSKPGDLVAGLRREGFEEADIVVRRSPPDEMPRYLSGGDLGLSFIRSYFSKKGSSPTKVAEYLACGLPVVLNRDIGDQADLEAEREACVVVGSYEEAVLTDAADRALRLAKAPAPARALATRAAAKRHFDLERVGVARYERLYQAITGGKSAG